MIDSTIQKSNYDTIGNTPKDQQEYTKSKFNPKQEAKKPPQKLPLMVQNFNIAIQKNELLIPSEYNQQIKSSQVKIPEKKDISIYNSSSAEESNNMSVSRIVYNPHISFSSVNRTVNKLVEQIGETETKPTKQKYYFNQNGVFKSTINVSSGDSRINSSSDYNNSNLFQVSKDQFTLISNDDYIFNSNNNADKLYNNYSNFSNYKEDLIQGDRLVKQMIETNMRKAMKTYTNNNKEFNQSNQHLNNMVSMNNKSIKQSKQRINDKHLPCIIEETNSSNKKKLVEKLSPDIKLTNKNPLSINSKISNCKNNQDTCINLYKHDELGVKKGTIYSDSIKLSLISHPQNFNNANNADCKDSCSIKDSKNILMSEKNEEMKKKDLSTLNNITYQKKVEINNSKMTSCMCVVF